MEKRLTETTTATITKALTVREAAINYARKGIKIFPCKGSTAEKWSDAKAPLTHTGFKEATCDIAQVKAWWDKWPEAFIGIATGQANDLTVIDVDSHEDKEFVGLLMGFASASCSPVVKTSKGHHVYFKYNPVLNTTTKRRKGIDIRSENGYVIAPPSSHLPSGFAYELIDGDITTKLQIPADILSMLLPEQGTVQPSRTTPLDDAAIDDVKRALARIPSDNRDDWIQVGMVLHNELGLYGLSLWDKWSQSSNKYNASEIQYHWESFAKPYNGAKVGIGTIFHLAKKQSLVDSDSGEIMVWREPLPLQSNLLPVTPLAPAMLPDSIRDWVIDIAERMNCPADFVAVDSVVALGSLIGTRCTVQPRQNDTDWKVVPNLWGAVVADPGMKKTPALEASLEFLKNMEQTNQAEHKELQFRFDAEMEEFKAKAEEAKKTKGAMQPFAKPHKPILKRHILKACTVEKLGEIAGENPQGVLVLSDELSGLLSKLDDKEKYQDRGLYMEAWNGDGHYSFDTISRGTIYIPHLCLSILGNIQPEKLQQYIGNIRKLKNNDGLIQRFQLFVYPDTPEFKGIVDRAPNEHAKQKARRLFNAIAKSDFTAYGAKNGEAKPYFVFANDAQQMASEWANKLEHKIFSKSEEDLLLQHISKYRSLMPTLALIFHICKLMDEDKGGDISLEATQQAIAWCDYLESHIRRIYGSKGGNDFGTVQLAKMIESGKLGKAFSMRDVYRNEPAGLTNADRAESACKALEILGWIAIDERKKKGTFYKVNPKLNQSTMH